jgi:hypothetical protein
MHTPLLLIYLTGALIGSATGWVVERVVENAQRNGCHAYSVTAGIGVTVAAGSFGFYIFGWGGLTCALIGAPIALLLPMFNAFVCRLVDFPIEWLGYEREWGSQYYEAGGITGMIGTAFLALGVAAEFGWQWGLAASVLLAFPASLTAFGLFLLLMETLGCALVLVMEVSCRVLPPLARQLTICGKWLSDRIPCKKTRIDD